MDNEPNFLPKTKKSKIGLHIPLFSVVKSEQEEKKSGFYRQKTARARLCIALLGDNNDSYIAPWT